LKGKPIAYESKLNIEGCNPYDQNNCQNVWIIGLVGAFFVSIIINEVIHWKFLVPNVLQGLQNKERV